MSGSKTSRHLQQGTQAAQRLGLRRWALGLAAGGLMLAALFYYAHQQADANDPPAQSGEVRKP
jgi:hypothetical protein